MIQQPEPRIADEVVDYVARLHGVVDGLTADLARGLHERLRCRRGCAGCCQDEQTVLLVEAALIRREAAALLAEAPAHPPGACAFLDDEGACRVYAWRPYRCRTQGLPLRWAALDAAGQPEERRDICALNEAGPPLTALPADQCWTLGPVEARLVAAQEAAGLDPDARVALRALFQAGG